jgi:hypothetical protein
VVGDPGHAAGAGAVYVFTNLKPGWRDATPSGLTAPASAGEAEFGSAVAIAADGGTIAVGAPGQEVDGQSGAGAAYVLTSTSDWATDNEFQLTAGAQVVAGGAQLGQSVAISATGGTIAAGAPSQAEGQGAAYVFSESPTGWQPSSSPFPLTASDGAASDFFATSLALAGDASLIAVGAPGHAANSHPSEGAVYLYAPSTAGGWQPAAQSELTVGSAGDEFGSSVAISEDPTNGITLVVGAPGANPSTASSGVAYVFQGMIPLDVPIIKTAPLIVGSPVEGTSLAASFGTWETPTPITKYAYQWFDCAITGMNCVPIAGATDQTYTPTASDLGDTIVVQVTAFNDAGPSKPAASTATAVVTAPPPVPVNVTPPTVSGSPVVGDTLVETNGSWMNSPSGFAHQWEDCDANGNNCAGIAGATGQSYTLTTVDLGHTIVVQETASNLGGAGAPAESNPQTGVVQAPPAISPAATPAVALTASNVTLSDFVDPDGLATNVSFQYGLDPQYSGGGPLAYTASTPVAQIAPDFAVHPVTESLTDLVPNALYHFRLVASNSLGTATGPDQTFRTARIAPPGPPVLGQSIVLTRVKGIVYVKLPSSAPVAKGQGFIPLTQARRLPTGTEVDARRGTLEIGAATGVRAGKLETGVFSGALFTVTQSRSGVSKGLITLSLLEGLFPGAPSYAGCTVHAAADGPSAHAAGLSSRILQTLRASDHGGRFQTRGRYSAATVRGTVWDTIDRCDGTETIVRRGTVLVTDFVRRKTIVLHAGQSYLARAVSSLKKRRK